MRGLAVPFLSVVLLMPLQGHAAAAPTALSLLEPGRWELRSHEPGQPPQRLCIHDFNQLIQLRHRGQACHHLLVEDEEKRTAISYSCPRTGRGQTVVRVETPRLIQIDSQGVADGAPFALDVEGRRIGACGPVARK